MNWLKRQLSTRALGGIVLTALLTLASNVIDVWHKRELLKIEKIVQLYKDRDAARQK